MVDDDYQLMSQKDIAKLKKEIESLRKGGKGGSLSFVLESIDKLNETIASLTDVFKEATMELKLSDHDNDSKRLRELEEKVDNLSEQNEKIAEAILTIADMSKEIKEEVIGMKDKDDSGSIPAASEDMGNPFASSSSQSSDWSGMGSSSGPPPPPGPPPGPQGQGPQGQGPQGPPPPPQGYQGQQQGGLPPLQPPPFNPQQDKKKQLFGFK